MKGKTNRNMSKLAQEKAASAAPSNCETGANRLFSTKYIIMFGSTYFIVNYLMNGNDVAQAALGAIVAMIAMKVFYELAGKRLLCGMKGEKKN